MNHTNQPKPVSNKSMTTQSIPSNTQATAAYGDDSFKS